MLLPKCANKAHLPASSKSLRLENWRPWASPAVSTFVNNISANAACKVQSKLLKQIQLNHLIIHQYYILLNVHIMNISWNHQLQTSKVQTAATGTKGTTEVPVVSSEDSHPSRENFAPQSHLPKGMCTYQVRFEKNRIGSRNTIWMFPNRGWGRHRSAVFRDSKPSLHLLHSQCWKDPVAVQASMCKGIWFHWGSTKQTFVTKFPSALPNDLSIGEVELPGEAWLPVPLWVHLPTCQMHFDYLPKDLTKTMLNEESPQWSHKVPLTVFSNTW